MSTGEFDLREPELTADDVPVLDDPQFGVETVAVVTGAASGIGRATAVTLAANGLSVVGNDVDEDGLDGTHDLADAIHAPGTNHPAPTDLTDDGYEGGDDAGRGCEPLRVRLLGRREAPRRWRPALGRRRHDDL